MPGFNETVTKVRLFRILNAVRVNDSMVTANYQNWVAGHGPYVKRFKFLKLIDGLGEC